MRAYIRSRYASALTDAELDDHINEAYRDVSLLFTPDTLEEDGGLSTVTGQATYTLMKDSRRIREVHLGTGASRNRLRSVRHEALVYPRASGAPTRWYAFGMKSTGTNVRQQFGLDPVPITSGTTLTVMYEPEPAELTTDTSTPLYVPEEFHPIICYGALSLAAGQQQDYNVSQNWQTRFTAAYNELTDKLGRISKSNFPEATKPGGGSQ